MILYPINTNLNSIKNNLINTFTTCLCLIVHSQVFKACDFKHRNLYQIKEYGIIFIKVAETLTITNN